VRSADTSVMTTIRTRCPACGDVDMVADEISLVLQASGERGEYGFVCPSCMDPVSKPANRKTVALLIAAGVEPSVGEIDHEVPVRALPAEDLGPDPDAAPFTMDDLIAFHFLLDDERAISESLALDA
jgi:hypothetical protein